MYGSKKLEQLTNKLGHQFSNQDLLIQALSHRSVPYENNERLEFLGDSVTNLIAAEMVFNAFQKAQEGELTRIRTFLVRGETLAQIAKNLGLGNYLLLGSNERRSGGAKRTTILADALEAVIAAIYLDSGFEHCKNCVVEWFKPLLLDLNQEQVLKDPKTQLQELLQAKNMGLPAYHIVSTTGKAHEQIFTVECTVTCPVTEKIYREKGSGTSRRRAEQQTAQKMLAYLTKLWKVSCE